MLLREEACYFYFLLFHDQPTECFINKYINAHEKIPDLNNFKVEKINAVHIVVSKKLAAFSIEPWLRSKGDRHPLTVKLLLIAYIAESDGLLANCAKFNTYCNPYSLKLFMFGFQAFASLFYGFYQKVRYGIL